MLKTGEINTQFVGKSRITTGRFAYGVSNIRVREWGEGASLNIGPYCSIARDVLILLGGEHDVGAMSTFPFGSVYPDELGHIEGAGSTSRGDVNIGADVWIGTGATIMSGVTIGSGAVIAANAHVVKDVGPYEIVGGNPAKLIRKRFPQPIIDRLLLLAWWDLPTDTIKAIVPTLAEAPTVEVLDDLLACYRQDRRRAV